MSTLILRHDGSWSVSQTMTSLRALVQKLVTFFVGSNEMVDAKLRECGITVWLDSSHVKRYKQAYKASHDTKHSWVVPTGNCLALLALGSGAIWFAWLVCCLISLFGLNNPISASVAWLGFAGFWAIATLAHNLSENWFPNQASSKWIRSRYRGATVARLKERSFEAASFLKAHPALGSSGCTLEVYELEDRPDPLLATVYRTGILKIARRRYVHRWDCDERIWKATS